MFGNIIFAAKYRRIIEVKRIAFSIASVTICSLQSFTAGIFSIFHLRLFTYLYNSFQHLPSLLSINFKNASADFSAASSCFDRCFSSSVYCTHNFLLLYAFLTFSYRLISL